MGIKDIFLRSIKGKKPHRDATGPLGERITARYLRQLGYSIVAMNYRKKWGEIDIIATKGNEIHFVEVKSTTVDDLSLVQDGRETDYRPEELVHHAKQARLRRTIETYLLEEPQWNQSSIVIDVAVAYVSKTEPKGRVRLIEGVTFV